jgi:DNA-binding CsgD family transcriptional regulator/tetratricopeptide (TPR) repeat protein
VVSGLAGPLLERSGELDRIQICVDAASRGRGSVLLIEGPAGIGKTSLLAAGVELARDAGLRAMSARARELERDLSWNVVRQLFGAVIGASPEGRGELLVGAAALAAPALGLSRDSQVDSLHGLYWLCVALAERAPRALVVDDAHWGDPLSQRFLAYIAERVADLPLLLLVTARRGADRGPALAAVAATDVAETISLRQLTAAATAQLARSELGEAASDEFCAACHQASGGNPFLLHELLRELGRDRGAATAERAAAVAAVTPETVSRSVLLRVSRLAAGPRQLASAVALLGGGSTMYEAATLAGLDLEDGPSAAEALTRADILRSGATLEFVHPIVREVLYEELGSLERARRHGDAARVLATAGASPEKVAAQLLQSAPSGDAWVLERLREAASRAIGAGAPAIAADLLERALREPLVAEARADVLVELGRAECTAGRPDAAARFAAALEHCSDPLRRAEILLELGRVLYVGGQQANAATAIEEGLAVLGASRDAPASLLAELQAALLTVARIEPRLRERAVELMQELASRPASIDSYGERALLAQVAGQLVFEAAPRERALELARLALGDGDLIRQETSDGMSWVSAMGVLGWCDDFDGFDAVNDLALADARRRGSVTGYATAIYGYSFSHYYRGMLADAVVDAEQAIAAERDGWSQFLLAARAQLAWALIERGELDAATAVLDGAGDEPSGMQALILEARARIHLARVQPGLALHAALAAGRLFSEQALIPNPSLLPWRSRAAVAAAQLGDAGQAEDLLEQELALARRFGAPRPIGVALVATGVIRGATGLAALAEAVDVLAHSPAKLEYARALVLHGAALRHQGKLGAARERLRAGLDISAACGATAIEARANNELVAADGRPRRRRSTGADALTPAEQRIARQAIEGMTNREIAQASFISLRTVETHLTHTYQKLGITTRTELGAMLLQAANRQPEP